MIFMIKFFHSPKANFHIKSMLKGNRHEYKPLIIK
jgi:hypothetical protein